MCGFEGVLSVAFADVIVAVGLGVLSDLGNVVVLCQVSCLSVPLCLGLRFTDAVLCSV